MHGTYGFSYETSSVNANKLHHTWNSLCPFFQIFWTWSKVKPHRIPWNCFWSFSFFFIYIFVGEAQYGWSKYNYTQSMYNILLFIDITAHTKFLPLLPDPSFPAIKTDTPPHLLTLLNTQSRNKGSHPLECVLISKLQVPKSRIKTYESWCPFRLFWTPFLKTIFRLSVGA